jgi:galactokinase
MATVFAPGRVNLIGEHTDYTGGLVLPLALQLGITMTAETGGRSFQLASEGHEPVVLEVSEAAAIMGSADRLRRFEPAWARFPLAVAARMGVEPAITASMTSTLPIGGTGLSSSTALSCASVLIFGGTGEPLELAQLARQAEIDATGVQIGLMDQAAVMACRRDHAMLLDCDSLETSHVEVPGSMEILVVHSGQSRELADSAYNDRRLACIEIEKQIGPLRQAGPDRLDEIDDPVLRRRARHVITENARVRAMVEALQGDDPVTAGAILAEGHASLAEDYEVSIPLVDELVAELNGTDGVFGARMTGGGFGGSLVALCRPGVTPSVQTWWARARPGDGAHRID